ncbi:MAG: vWA domain-containing protein, partial [Tissierellales bacterium]
MLDNTFLQIAVGFIPAILFFAFMSIFSKKNRIRNIICTGTFFFVASGLALPQLFEIGNQPPHKYDELSLVYAIAEEGSPELAKTLLGEMQNDYKPEYAIAAARLSAESGDYQGAKALYLKSLPLAKEVESEYSALVDLSEIDDKYYGISDEAEAQLIYSARADKLSQTSNTISTAVEDSIKETENNTYNKMAEYIVYADQVYKDYLYEEEIDKAEAEKQTKKLNIFLEKNPEFLKSNQVRLARLKLLLLSGDYKKIAASLSEDSDYNELLIVSELYLNNYVKQSNFSDEYLGESKEKYDAVYKKLNDIYSNSFQDKPREERNLARSQLNALKTIVENPALGKMEEALSEYASKEYAIDASKAYLQMAKIEHSLGNNPKSVEYIDRSIDTVGDCEDSDYTVPMYELVGIITDKDDPERLKDAAVYVDQVLENNMTIKISSHENTIKPESDEDSFAGDFTSQMQTYISQKRMSVNIVNIDTRDFDSDNTIKATVNISNNLYTSVDELKAALSINDCGVDIPDFTVEKVNYSGANILLCVDTSGSMSGYKIDNLKNAIKIFAADKSNIEDIALVTFSNGVGNDYPFGLSVDELSTAADSIRASGGTAIYKSVLHSIGKFMDNPDVINSIIVMTDGLDGYRASIEEIEEYIGKPSIEKGITIYTIGFGGDADGSYLNSIASATGGAYLYANEPTSGTQVNQLGEFFNGLRAQILNQYIITLKAKDTLSYSRELKVTVDHGLESDSATYYLGGGADSITDPGIDEDSPIYMNGKAINGFEPRMIYKNGKTLNTTLKGERFTAQDNINITLKGNTSGVEWDIGANFVDENSVSVTIPAGIGVDVYDVYVTINGKAAILPKGLSVFTQGSEKLTDFGPYRFVSYLKHEDKENNTMTLSGYVTMNGWLSFKEDITLSGNLKDDSITLTDMYGSSVFYDDQNSQGLASVLADVGLPVIIPALKTIRLYNDPEHEKQSG